MSGLEQIFNILHQNIIEGKLYEALMQYKSLFNRYSRRSIEHGIAIIQDGVEQLSKQNDLTSYFGLIEFYEKYLETHRNLINDKSIIPFNNIIEIPASEDKIKQEEAIIQLLNQTSFNDVKIRLNKDLGISYMNIGNINKALESFINDINDIVMLFDYVKQHNNIPMEQLTLLSVLKVLLSNTPTNARKIYQLIQDKYNYLLSSQAIQVSIIYIILIMKVVDKKDKKEDIEIAFKKATSSFETILKENQVLVFVDELHSKYFAKPQSSSNLFASLMESMMQGGQH
ncbi:hypothetical protein EHI8A_122340 [Entamoeba histolytica HM-1:IMSS-B]|uniref:Uncharacterized protein n=6 Tax=Entamoeba histolytica TaxID=5759 RepID=C4M7V6_ENTH1|nr:hypothetical protein EHI_029550 [Entamoeba histolytica HM-1:IMSS]EMD45243.1 Hypothetical protein EHI5A_149250 [Entamoeba histolytica KU27]EMH75033.1 hypothetical protein EHI8A_122340 [Entamoeba histolytica HM-1:IMSS-B]EMS17151.1 hypothetical protein KM1_193380 [Entamoeba histolytica HM-3:IMSS]ENY60128.1 hypothetical protein EHI7A_113110 [Entamoeba histolytica HM-1:IMSS-A]GAT97640.1 hypothetical protein CL6EHI_029550 [Entamoeba histolytica]|eukprot:XP_650077.1 hypothetical protein EHI_029550 [Entamoeba histolytica HM-1:IMSS]